MSTDFFVKKILKLCFTWMSILFTGACCLYAAVLGRVKIFSLQTGFFYLAREDVNVEVGLEFVKLDGGAGYLLECSGKDYVILSVYLNEKDGLAVQSGLDNNVETRLFYQGVENLYFKTRRQKKNAAAYVGAFRVFRSCIAQFNNVVGLLEDGCTQERTKEILSSLSRQFFTFEKKYRYNYAKFSAVCNRYGKTLQKLCDDIIFVGELRYQLCDMTVEYLTLANEFTL